MKKLYRTLLLTLCGSMAIGIAPAQAMTSTPDDGGQKKKNSTKSEKVTIIGTDLEDRNGEEEETETEVLKIPIGDFNKIYASFSYKIKFVQGPATGSATVKVKKNQAKYISIKTEKNTLTLTIDSKGENIRRFSPEVTVTAPSLEFVQTALSASFRSEGQLMLTTPLTLVSQLSSMITIPYVNAPKLTATSSTSGAITCLKTDCRDIYAAASTSGVVTIKGIEAEKVSASASTSATVALSGHTATAHIAPEKITSGVIVSEGLVIDIPIKGKNDNQTELPRFREP